MRHAAALLGTGFNLRLKRDDRRRNQSIRKLALRDETPRRPCGYMRDASSRAHAL